MYADLSGLVRGRYNLPVRFDQPADVRIVGLEPGAARRPAPLRWRARLFGTDGIRGTAGACAAGPADRARIGAAIVRVLEPDGARPRLLIGRDTRESGGWIERELAHGARLSRRGCRDASASLPTPAVAYLTRGDRVSLGAVISASHNPYQDNGIKVFSGAGHKFTEELERQVEAIVADSSWHVGSARGAAGCGGRPIRGLPGASRAISSTTRGRCPARSSSSTAPTGRRRPWRRGCSAASVSRSRCSATAPDGRNINLHCGSTHPAAGATAVSRAGAALGVAFDGDGDRAIFVDEAGRVVDGDAVMLMCARQLKAEGRLRGNTVVATVMSNIGLELALGESGIELRRTQVGDKYVMEEMLRDGFSLGGEQSGHIDLRGLPVHGRRPGDRARRAARRWRRRAARLSTRVPARPYPQVLVNVRVRERKDLARCPRSRRSCGTWSRASRATAGCWCAIRAPSRCCASCSKDATETRLAAGLRR